MKKLTKILPVIAIIAILVVSLSVFVACTPDPVEEDSTFVVVVRKAAETYSDETWLSSPSIEGDVLVQKEIAIKAGQSTVADAFAAIDADDAEGTMKIMLSDTDYLVFTYSEYYSSWSLTSGYIVEETGYVDADFLNSYFARNDVMSSGISYDALDGIETLTIVIDGWDGTIGA